MAHDEQTALGNKGSPFTIQHNGVTYPVSFLTQKVKADVVRWAKQQVIRELDDLRDVIGEEDYLDRKNKHITACQEGAFGFDSESVMKLRNTLNGQQAFIRAILGDKGQLLSEGELIDLIAEQGDKIMDYVRMGQIKLKDELKSLGHDPEKAEKQYRMEMGIADGAEPTPEQQAELQQRMQKYEGTLDPKVRVRCLRAAGLME
jgi:hypothetical protein